MTFFLPYANRPLTFVSYVTMLPYNFSSVVDTKDSFYSGGHPGLNLEILTALCGADTDESALTS